MHQRLPVVLVAGFFAAGKTSLIHHLLSENQAGYQAVLVEELGSVSNDARALQGVLGARRRLYDTVLSVPFGLNGEQSLAWFAEQLRGAAQSGRFQRVWVELSGATSLVWLARQFRVLPDQPEGFSRFAYLHQAVLVVDALDFLRTVVVPAQRRQPSPWLDFHHGQIEAATILVLNKCDQIDDEARLRCQKFLRVINPDALIVETDFGEVPLHIWDRPSTFQQAALATEKRLQLNPHETEAHGRSDPPPLACRVFRQWRPLHPQRFWDWFNEDHPALLRLKGIIWLATRSLLVGAVSRNRWQNGCGAAGVWWAALPEEEWPQREDQVVEIHANWHEPYGDRRQELTLIGEEAGLDKIVEGLTSALLTDSELEAGPDVWTQWPDPFPEWDLI